jgi:hypothetical protein
LVHLLWGRDRLKRIVADTELEIAGLREIAKGNF